MNQRFADVITETQGTVTEEQLKCKIIQHILRRLSDQQYDKHCARRFKDLSEKEVEALLVEDIIDGKE